VTIQTRGPVETDMPAYTLRGYKLHWLLRSADDATTLAQGDLPIPTLQPGTTWTGEIEGVVRAQGSIIHLSILRPTGFTVCEGRYDLEGNLLK
jgi:hypothetical protein